MSTIETFAAALLLVILVVGLIRWIEPPAAKLQIVPTSVQGRQP